MLYAIGSPSASEHPSDALVAVSSLVVIVARVHVGNALAETLRVFTAAAVAE
jgi:hypothetical protein